MIITYRYLIFNTPFNFERVSSFEIVKKINQHATLNLQGVLHSHNTENIWDIRENQPISIQYKINDENQPVFFGIITELKLTHINENYYLTINAKSYSFLMDIEKKKRSFQNKNMLYNDIYKKIVNKDHKGNFIDDKTSTIMQNRTIIQYNETDWEFLKRIVSHNEAVLLPETNIDGVNVYIGIPKLKDITEEEFNYTIRKKINLFEKHQKNFNKDNDLEYVSFEVESTKIYDIGNNLTYNQIALAITEVKIRLENGMLKNIYKLQLRSSTKQMEIKNSQINGVSINGKILAVESNKLKLHLEIDKTQSVIDAHFYEYNTPYSTESTTGFYVMPQVGDIAKLYIPNLEEDNAYVRLINRTDGNFNPKTSDPKIKYLGTIDGKELKMSPTEVLFEAKSNETCISLHTENGINIKSKPKIKIISCHNISFNSDKKIVIKASEEIKIKTSISNITMDNKTNIKSPLVWEIGISKK